MDSESNLDVGLSISGIAHVELQTGHTRDTSCDGNNNADYAASLRKWLEAKSIYIHPEVQICTEGDTSNSICVRTKADLVSGTIVGTIPKSAVLSARTSGLSRWLPNGMQYFYTPEATCGLLLSTCLLYEYLIGELSQWYGYIQSLPRERVHDGQTQLGVSLPLEWDRSSKEWRAIQHCEAGRVARRAEGKQSLPMTKTDNVALHHVLSYYQARAVPFLQQAGMSIKDNEATRSLFVGCYTLVSSRAFVCDTYHGLVLCPFADAFNHADYMENQVQFECDDEPMGPGEETIDMTMTKGVIEGSDIFNSYGPISNARLLTIYGFCLEDETASERFTWDWRDEVERNEIAKAVQVDIERWAEALSVLVGDVAAGRETLAESHDPIKNDVDGQALLPPLPKISPFAHLATIDITHEPHVVDGLSFILAIDDQEDDVQGDVDEDKTPPSSDIDVHLPFYVDGQGRISVPFWRAVVLACLMRKMEAIPPPEEIKETIRTVEERLASGRSVINDDMSKLLSSTCQVLIDLISTRLIAIADHQPILPSEATPRLESALRHYYQERCILDIALHNLQTASRLEGQIE